MITKPNGLTVFGLTGGIGSGKSTVGSLLAGLGIPVIDADFIAKQQSKKGSPVFQAIVSEFGPAIVGQDGEIDRKALASLVFNDTTALRRLNILTHRHVEEEINRRLSVIRETGGVLAIVMAALLYETGLYKDLDGLIVVVASEDDRIRWVMKRSGMSAEEVRARMAVQACEHDLKKAANFLIENHGSLSDLEAATVTVAHRIVALVRR